jgi:S-disulfanyl-L-cysteine oxidoreductase SoxD
MTGLGSFAILRRMGPLGMVILSGCTVQSTSGRPVDTTQQTTSARADVVEAEQVRFGLGAPASDRLIASWDIDARPDGRGLPAGSGSVAEGQVVYGVQCARCHGPTGREGPFARLAGEAVAGFPFGRSAQLRGRRTVGNYWPYATTLFDYVRRAMPFDAPGTLSTDQIYGAVAYVLYLNELVADDAVMDSTTLPAVLMPARDRFVRDNRTGGAVVR